MSLIISLTPTEVDVCRDFASQWSYPGRSSVRDSSERSGSLNEDQLTGLLGNLAFCVWMFGRSLGLHQFAVTRWASCRDPFGDDGGCDVPMRNVDVKSQLLRSTLPLDRYLLPVRPKELRADWVYVHALVEKGLDRVHLRGWAASNEFPSEPEVTGPIAGALAIPYSRLHPLLPLRTVVGTPS